MGGAPPARVPIERSIDRDDRRVARACQAAVAGQLAWRRIGPGLHPRATEVLPVCWSELARLKDLEREKWPAEEASGRADARQPDPAERLVKKRLRPAGSKCSPMIDSSWKLLARLRRGGRVL